MMYIVSIIIKIRAVIKLGKINDDPVKATNYTYTETIITIYCHNFVDYYVIAVDEGDNESDESNSVRTRVVGPAGAGDLTGSLVTPESCGFNVTPNPFNPSTKLVYNVSNAMNISLKVYDVSGQVVADLANGI